MKDYIPNWVQINIFMIFALVHVLEKINRYQNLQMII